MPLVEALKRTLRLASSLTNRFPVVPSTQTPNIDTWPDQAKPMPKPFSSGEVCGRIWIWSAWMTCAPMDMAARQPSDVAPGWFVVSNFDVSFGS